MAAHASMEMPGPRFNGRQDFNRGDDGRCGRASRCVIHGGTSFVRCRRLTRSGMGHTFRAFHALGRHSSAPRVRTTRRGRVILRLRS